MANVAPRSAATTRRSWTIAVWTLQGVAAAAFLAAGGAKLVGAAPMVEIFDKIGVGQWFRFLTGTLEITGAVLILLPRTAFWGGLLLACVMTGAVVTHLVAIGGNPGPATALLAITATVAVLRGRDALHR